MDKILQQESSSLLSDDANHLVLFLGEIILAWTACTAQPVFATACHVLGAKVIPHLLPIVQSKAAAQDLLDTKHARAWREWIGIIILEHGRSGNVDDPRHDALLHTLHVESVRLDMAANLCGTGSLLPRNWRKSRRLVLVPTGVPPTLGRIG